MFLKVLISSCPPLQVIVYVDDANDEVPVFTQQQYNRLGLRETAGIGTSVIVVRATDPDTGEFSLRSIKRAEGVDFDVSSCCRPFRFRFYPHIMKQKETFS